MKIKLFTCTNASTLENDVNEYLESFKNTDIIDIKMSESDNYNSIMVITRD